MAILRYTVDITGFTGGPGKNVFHARADDSNVESIATQLSDKLRTFYTSMVGKCAAGVSFKLGQVIDVDSNELVPAGTLWTSSTAAGNALPRAVAIVVGWRTATVARRGMGRTFLGPLGNTCLQSDGTIDALALQEITTAANTLISSSSSVVGGMFGVYGYQNALPKGTERDPNAPRVLRDFQSAVVKDQFAVLRSRRD